MKAVRRSCSCTLLLLLAALSSAAQESDQPRVGPFADVVEVEVVNVEVFVTDKAGNPVTGLQRDDFEVFLDGRPVPSPYFYAAAGGRAETRTAPAGGAGRTPRRELLEPEGTPADQRLHVALVVDNEHLRAVNRKRAFRELRAFLDERLADDALLTVVSLNPELVIHSDLTADRRVVARILDELEGTAGRPGAPELERRQILDELSTSGRIYNRADYSSGGVPYDPQSLLTRVRAWAASEFSRSQATLRTLGQLVGSLAGVPGRKALLYVSDGIANRPGEEIFEAWTYRYGDATPAPQGYRSAGMTVDYLREIGRFDLLPQIRELADLANTARVTWYAIDAESDHGATLKSAATSGGVATEAIEALENNVREPAETASALTGGRRLQMRSDGLDLRAVSTDFDSFYSLGFTPPPGSEERTHKIRVEVRGKGLVVRHRESWEPKSKDERAADGTLAALLFNAVSNPLAVVLKAGAAERSEDGNTLLPLQIEIPLQNLLLLPSGETYAVRLSLFVTTRDRAGLPRPVQKLPFGAGIPAAKLEEALGESVRYTLPVVVRPGDQEIALGVRDEHARTESFVRLELTSLGLGTEG